MPHATLRARLASQLHNSRRSLAALSRTLPVVARGQQAAIQALAQVERRFPALTNLWLSLRAAAGAPLGPTERERAEWSAALAELSQSPDWRSRASAAVSLSMIGLRAASAPGMGPEQPRRGAAHGRVVQALTAALRDSSAEVAACAADALGNLADPQAVTALREVVDNRDGYFNAITRAAAVRALSRCLGDAELAFVFAAVRDVQPEVSMAAIATVLSRAREAALFHLLPVLQDETGFFAPEVRAAAREGLRAAGVLSPSLEAELQAR